MTSVLAIADGVHELSIMDGADADITTEEIKCVIKPLKNKSPVGLPPSFSNLLATHMPLLLYFDMLE